MIEGYELTLGIITMLRACHKAGSNPIKVVMHPDDFLAMKDEDGNRWTLLMVYGIPIEVTADTEPGKIYALNALPL